MQKPRKVPLTFFRWVLYSRLTCECFLKTLGLIVLIILAIVFKVVQNPGLFNELVKHLSPSPVTDEVNQYAEHLKAEYFNYRVAKSDKFPHTLSNVFIELTLVEKASVDPHLTLTGDIDEILKFKEPIELDDILKADDKVRLVVVEGAPGIGKTTLAWELCRQWLRLESLKRFSLIVLLRLREEGVQSAKDISDLFYHPNNATSRHVGEEVVRREGGGVLFVFDGFDEFPYELQQKSLVMDIISGSKHLPKATVLVTTRPSASAQLQKLLQTGIDKHIMIVGFTEKKILEFAHTIIDNPNHFKAFIDYLTANPVVKRMMYNPLNCAIVVGVYKDTYESGKPVRTQTQLYTELTLWLLSRYLNTIGDPLGRNLPDNLEDLPYDSDLYQQLVKVGELAFNGKLRKQVIFKQLPDSCSDLGLLVKYTALYTRKQTTTYNFFHLTLQEYMSAFYISQLSVDKQRTLFQKHSTSMDVVWRFVAGLTKMQNIGWEEFKKTNAFQYKLKNDIVVVGRFLLECLYEVQDVRSCGRVFGQNRVEFKSKSSNVSLYALGYCIPVCSNTWNITISGIANEGLEILARGMKSVNYGGGSIEELDLSWSQGIMNGERLSQIPHQILQHIKSLKLKGCDIDQRGFENLTKCIPYLHSLTLLDISNNPGGDGSLVKLLQALRRHGKLQILDIQHISIGMDDVAALADLVQPSSSYSLRELAFDESHLTPEVAKQLVRTVLSPSSLNTVKIYGCKYPLDAYDVETITVGISSLTFEYLPPHLEPNTSPHLLTVNPNRFIKGGTKLSHVLLWNTSLKELKLHIPLDKDEIQDIIDSLKYNYSLRRLELSEEYHSKYFSKSKRRALDPRIDLANA